MNLRRRNRGRGAAMDVTLEISDRLLPGRVIAERDVDVRVDQAGNKRRATGVDHDVGGFYGSRRRGADGGNEAVLANDGIAGDGRLAPVAGDDLSDVDDRDTHGVGPVQ